MEGARQFGKRLRELRNAAGLSLRELAEKVNVDFTYLSKIENGVLPAPSDKVIARLARALNADQDELTTLAGRIPSDIAEMLKDRRTLELLRSERTQKKFKPQEPRRIIPVFNYRNVARIAAALVLVIAVGASLWFAAPLPARALEVTFPDQPDPGTLGTTHTFITRINVQDMDVLPVVRVDLEIYNVSDSSKKATLEYLPLDTSAKAAHSIKEGLASGSAEVASTADTLWGYATADSFAYGYREPQGIGWSYFGIRGGYGYGQSPYMGSTNIQYTIYWTSPSGWPGGNYRVKVLVYGDATQKFSGTSNSFSLSAPVPAAPSGDTGPAAPPRTEPKTQDVSGITNAQGVFTEPFTLEARDGRASVTIDEGTVGRTSAGQPIEEITITRVDDPPALPADSNVVGFAYDFEPDGATFEPPITLTFTYGPSQIPAGADAENLVIMYWDEDAGEWTELAAEDITIDPVTNTITARVSHFTYFSIVAHTGPASFSASNLSITPSEAEVGESVTVRATITNTGDLSGQKDIVFKVNNVMDGITKVSLKGKASQEVTFTTIQGEAGTYTVDINGLTGTFTVTEGEIVITTPPAPPPTPAPTPTPAPVPTPTPAPAPAPAPIPWMIIGIIAAVAVIVAGVLVWYFGFRERY